MQLGRIIAGKYCLLHELGRGGMGSVWVAEHISLRSQVAIKLIEPEVVDSSHAQRFEREARALATLRSAHVVQILDYGIDADIQYLVMELLQGRTLRHELDARGRLTPHEVWTVVMHVSRAMTVSHSAGFVHRDLKPENIFLVHDHDGNFNTKVLDFGITKALAPETLPLTATGGVLGTCEYMSPEQAVGENVDTRSDLWTLAVVAFESLVGFTPFRAKSAVVALSAICHGPIVVPSEVARVPPGFDAWFARAVQRDPDQRFQSARQLAAELQPVLDLPRDWVDGDTAVAVRPEHDEDTLLVHPSAVSPFDRRGSERISSSIPAAIGGQRDLRNSGLIYNTSRSGALLATRRRWECEQTITLTLHIDSAYEGATVRAQVVRVAERDSPLWKFDIAIRFLEPLSEELLARVEAKARTRGR